MKVLHLAVAILAGGIGGANSAPLNPTYDFAYAEFIYTYETQTLTGNIDALNLEDDGTVTGGEINIESLYLASGRGVVTVTGDALTRPQVYTLTGPADPISSYVYAKDFEGPAPDLEMSGFPEYYTYQGGEPFYGIWEGSIELAARPIDGFDYEIWDAGFTFSGNVGDWAWYSDQSDAYFFGTLAPVPLPASGLLLFAGIGGAVAFRKKRKL